MSQSRRQSAIEAVTNVIVGFVLAVLAQARLFPLFGLHVPPRDHVVIALAFTGLSLLRSYVLRRLFARLDEIPRHGG